MSRTAIECKTATDTLMMPAISTTRSLWGLLVSLSPLALSQATWAVAVPLQQATATFSQISWPAAEAIDGSFGSQNGWAILNSGQTLPEIAVFETVSNISFPGGADLTFTIHSTHANPGHNLGRFRLSVTTDDRTQFADGLSSGGDVVANWTILVPLTATSTGGAILTILGDNSILA